MEDEQPAHSQSFHNFRWSYNNILTKKKKLRHLPLIYTLQLDSELVDECDPARARVCLLRWFPWHPQEGQALVIHHCHGYLLWRIRFDWRHTESEERLGESSHGQFCQLSQLLVYYTCTKSDESERGTMLWHPAGHFMVRMSSLSTTMWNVK